MFGTKLIWLTDSLIHWLYTKTRNQSASPPRHCNTDRPLERFWRNFVSLRDS